MPQVPGHKRTQGSVRRNLFNIGEAEKAWEKINAASLETLRLSPEELATRRREAGLP